jgi:hypothetical protein
MSKIVLILALVSACHGQTIGSASTELTYFGNSTRKVVRTAELGGHFFVVEYLVNYGGTTFVPATYPSGKPHYGAVITVFEIVAGAKAQIGTAFDGQYTDDEGCFEDDPLSLILGAYGAADKVPAGVTAAIQEKRERDAFEKMPLYSESAGVLQITAKGKRDLYQVKIGERVLWTNTDPAKKPKEPENLTATMPGASGSSLTFGVEK